MTRLIALSLFSLTACGQDGLRFAELKDWKLQSGRSVPVCRIGYRTFGSLNGARSNAVLFPTWFSGTSADLEGLIGPEKLVDSSRFFVIAFDAPGNGVSCSPTNTPDFPLITVGDMVEAEFRFVTEILKIRKRTP